MSKKPEKKSSAESGQPEQNFVFDIIYHDARRIGSFISQFEPNGHLQSVTASQSVTDSENSKGGAEATFGVPLVAQAKIPWEWNAASSLTEGASKTYDPIWSNALAFLDYLHQHSLVHKDINTAKIGQFVQSSGELVVLDLGFFQQVYRLPLWQDKARAFIDPVTQATRPDVETDLQFMQIVPSQIQAYLTPSNDAQPIFGGLKPEGLATSAPELFMKYGHTISGEWTIVGVKDADPDGNHNDLMNAQPRLATAITNSGYLNEYLFLAARVRGWLGRQANCFGVTPLIIFRQIGN